MNQKEMFIKLDKNLLLALGSTKAILLCHFIGISSSFKKEFYQTTEQIQNNTGFDRRTISKALKELKELNLMEISSHNERNKNYYKISYDNVKILKSIMDQELEINNSFNSEVGDKVLKIYKSRYINATISRDINATTSRYNNDTTEKDLLEKNQIEKDIISNKSSFWENDACLPYKEYLEDYFKSVSYKDMQRFKEKYPSELFISLGYFLYCYHCKYNKWHITSNKIDLIENILNKLDSQLDKYCCYSINAIGEMIKEFMLNTPGRETTLNLFVSGEPSYIQNLAERIK